MSKLNSFLDHPLATLEEALSLRKQIAALQAKLGSLLDGVKAKPAVKTGRSKMSAAGRARIAAAARARWAKIKKDKPAVVTAPAVKAPKKKKSGLTPEGRAKLAAAMKARWVLRKKAAADAAKAAPKEKK